MIYEYHCGGCDLTFDRMRPVAECHEPAACPQCNKPAKRIMSMPRVIFNSDSFPSHALRGDAFWRPDGRNLYKKEIDFLEREAADDAAAEPNTCVNSALNKASIPSGV